MGGSKCIGDLRCQLQPCGKRQLVDAAETVGVVEQAALRCEGRLDEVRRVLEVPVEHRCQVGAFAECVLK